MTVRLLCSKHRRYQSINAVCFSCAVGDKIIDLCRKCFCDEDLRQAALATKLFVFAATHAMHVEHSTTTSVTLLNECADCMESLLLLLAPMCEHSKRDFLTLKVEKDFDKPEIKLPLIYLCDFLY